MVDDSQKESPELVEWAPDQLIYDFDTPAFQAYLVVDGNADIFSPKGLKLNSIGTNEIFGESSLLLDRRRSVAAKAGVNGASAHVISKEYFSELQEESPMLSAILRKVQLRLEDSNSQSVKYANQIDVILNLVKDLTELDNKLISEKLERIKENLKDNSRAY